MKLNGCVRVCSGFGEADTNTTIEMHSSCGCGTVPRPYACRLFHQASQQAVFLLQAFLASAKIQGAFQPPPAPPLQLTQLDQCRIRDRSTIMARHLFAYRGDAYADEQACPALAAECMCQHPSMPVVSDRKPDPWGIFP